MEYNWVQLFFTKQLHRRNFSVNNDIHCTLFSHKSLKRLLFGNHAQVIWTLSWCFRNLYLSFWSLTVMTMNLQIAAWRLPSLLCTIEEETWVWKETSVKIIWKGLAFFNKWEIMEWPVFLMIMFLQGFLSLLNLWNIWTLKSPNNATS